MNLYAYAGNDPVNGRDPSGLSLAQELIRTIVVTATRLMATGLNSGAVKGGAGFSASGRTTNILSGEVNPDDIVVTATRPRKGTVSSTVAPKGHAAGADNKEPCSGVNIAFVIDGSVFLGFGGGFSLGANFNLETRTLSGFSAVRAGVGFGLILGAGININNSAPNARLSSSTNSAVGFGPVGGEISFPSTGGVPSVSGGVSIGPKLGLEISRTDAVGNVINTAGGDSACGL